MKQNDHLSYTILDAEYQVLDAEQPVNRGVRRGILITALILVALGLSALIFPEVIGTGLAFFITSGLFLYGLSQSLLFFQASKEMRSGWTLANGLLLLVFSWITMFSAFMGELGLLQMISAISFLMGLLTASIGLSQISAAITAGSQLPDRGWIFLGGGLNLLLSLFMCINPVVSWFALTTAWGIYLIAAAIALLFLVWSTRSKAHA
mgnify:FL=1